MRRLGLAHELLEGLAVERHHIGSLQPGTDRRPARPAAQQRDFAEVLPAPVPVDDDLGAVRMAKEHLHLARVMMNSASATSPWRTITEPGGYASRRRCAAATPSWSRSNVASARRTYSFTTVPSATTTVRVARAARSLSCVTMSTVFPLATSCSNRSIMDARRRRVEVAGRLVRDKQRRIRRERSGDRDPLLLTTRDGGGELPRLVGETDAAEQLERPLAPLARRPEPAELHGQDDVVDQRDRRQQLEELEDDADRPSPPLRRRPLAQVVHCRPVDPDLAARRAVDARDHVDERALAAAGLPDHGDELPRADLEAHALERGQAPRGRLVLLDDVVEIDQRTPVHAIEDRRPRPWELWSRRGTRATAGGGAVRRPSRRRLIIGLAVLVPLIIVGGLAIAVTTGLLLEDKATPVSIQDVLARFHEGERRTGKLDGVYLYATRGQESVDALGGATHRYPRSTTITLVTVPCGMRLLWEPFKERSVRWTLCATADGIELADWEVAHEFFGQGDRTGYTCTESVLVPAEEKSGASPFRCRSDQGRQDGETEMLGVEQVAVGNARRAGVHVRTVGQVTGGDSGTETTDWWLDERSGLPLRIRLLNRTGRKVLIGRVNYSEDVDLLLRSTKPLR